MFIDAHCHVDLLGNPKEIASIINRAKRVRAQAIVTNGVNVMTNRATLALAQEYESVHACLGVYPVDALKMNGKDLQEEIDFIRTHKKELVGIGEVGMDFSEDSEHHNAQQEIFTQFIALAQEIDKPVVVHSRKAEAACIDVLEEQRAKKVLMHYFSGKMTLVDRIVANGWFLSIPTGVVHSEHFQKVIARVPIEQLLCETDSPYSHPEKQFPNEPANVIRSYEKIAEIKKMSLGDVEQQLEKNFKNLFG